ncbi:MAG: 16S rRNA (adenine(1518)-N(6)/adenine(1519)-N(6))-dimethyltransferase RsmA [Clostridia bacterium]|nr:16S rRNA (adenine(1518)-N(6)/adenine(1519)-N(6))-dimethyltransferase RsmA [Clostridia bacterium]
MDYCSVQGVKALCEEFGFRFTKSLGQNFLISPQTVARIADAGEADKETTVLEIGPGFGAMTAALSERAARVVALEIDRSLFPVLEKTLADCPNVNVVEGDVLKADLASLFADDANPRRIVTANLPYYITTKTILRLLGSRLFDRLTVMIQKEAADKIVAAPGSEQWCLFSLLANYYADTKLLFTVPRSSFSPQPTVESAVVRLVPVHRLDEADEAWFLKIGDAIFAMRRKTIANCLKALLGAETLAQAAEIAKIDTSRRGESLSVDEAMALARAVRQITQTNAEKNSNCS